MTATRIDSVLDDAYGTVLLEGVTSFVVDSGSAVGVGSVAIVEAAEVVVSSC